MARSENRYYTEKKVRRQGKLDGRDWQWKPWRPFPGWPMWEEKDPEPMPNSATQSHYEAQIIIDANSMLEHVAESWHREDEKLGPEYGAAKDQLAQLNKEMSSETQEYQDAIKPHEDAKNAFLNYPPRWIPLWFYYLIFTVITAGEGFFNYFVFQMFGEEGWQTAIMASAIVLTMPLASELIGHFLKKEEKTSLDKTFIIGGIAVVAGLMVVMAVLRESFFEATKALSGIPLSPTAVSLILIVFNLAIFFVLTFLSYAESRIDPESYRKAKDKCQKAIENLNKQEGDVKSLTPALKSAIERLARAQVRREAAFNKYVSMAEKERDSWVAYIRMYRHANVTARRKHFEIISFQTDPEQHIKMPAKLTNIEW
jgi:hypothetical protein